MLVLKQLLVVMDDVFSINPKKDSSFAIMLSAQKRNYRIFCCQVPQIFAHNKGVFANVIEVKLSDTSHNFVQNLDQKTMALASFNVVLMRQNPPFDMNYIYASYLLEQAEKQGVLVINKPQSLRDFNEKFSILNFPNCIPNTLVASDKVQLLRFLVQQKTIVIKPLSAMGGEDIFKLSSNDKTTALEKITYLTQKNTVPIMAQRYLEEIDKGDKRILLIDGKPIPYALARIPKAGSFKGNLAQGATAIAQTLSQHDHWLCTQIAPVLKAKKLLFVGLDVIGNYITEINITSPTGIRELDKQCQLNIADVLLVAIEKKINAKH